jgi:hypothetical protein
VDDVHELVVLRYAETIGHESSVFLHGVEWKVSFNQRKREAQAVLVRTWRCLRAVRGVRREQKDN